MRLRQAAEKLAEVLLRNPRIAPAVEAFDEVGELAVGEPHETVRRRVDPEDALGDEHGDVLVRGHVGREPRQLGGRDDLEDELAAFVRGLELAGGEAQAGLLLVAGDGHAIDDPGPVGEELISAT